MMKKTAPFLCILVFLLILTACSFEHSPYWPQNDNDSFDTDQIPVLTPFGMSARSENSLNATNGLCLKGKIYKIPEGSSSLPDLNQLSPFAHIKTTTLNIPSQDWEEGFPGAGNVVEWFAISYRGQIRLENDQTAYFTLKSDDGAILLINDQIVVNNDGLHPPTDPAVTGQIDLPAGNHDIEIRYYQGPRYHVQLQVLYNADSPPPIEENQESGALMGSSLNYLLDMEEIGLE